MVAALGFARRQLPQSPPDRAAQASRAVASRLNIGGMMLVTAGPTALMLALVEGVARHWPTWTWARLAASPALLGVFAAREPRLSRRGHAPLLDLSLLRHRGLAAGLATQLAFWCGQASFFLVLALYLRDLTHCRLDSCSRSWRRPTWSPRSALPV